MNFLFGLLLIFFTTNAIILIEPSIDSCTLSEEKNAIVDYEMSATCTLSFAFKDTYEATTCGSKTNKIIANMTVKYLQLETNSTGHVLSETNITEICASRDQDEVSSPLLFADEFYANATCHMPDNTTDNVTTSATDFEVTYTELTRNESNPDQILNRTERIADCSTAATVAETHVETLSIVIKVGGGPQYETKVRWYDAATGEIKLSVDTEPFKIDRPGLFEVKVQAGGEDMTSANIRIIPGWVTLLPPLVLLVLALWTQQILVSMPVAIMVGAWLIDEDLNPIQGFWRSFDTYFVNSLGDVDHAYVLTFTFLLAGIVSLCNRNGGTQGVANSLVPYIVSSTSSQWVTFVEGLAIFFDDYADTLICGNTLKVFVDTNRVSREKFSFLVDATAAPIASIAPLSSWIGFEIGLIEDTFVADYGEEFGETDAYMVFLATIPYRFYPWFMLFFIIILTSMKRDFGPMVNAERRARKTGKVLSDTAKVDPAQLKNDPHMEPNDDVKERGDFFWYLAEIPILIVILGTFIGIMTSGAKACDDDGLEKSAKNIFSNGDSFSALIWACMTATLFLIIGSVWKKVLTFEECIEAWIYGLKTMVEPLVLLCWAWSVGAIMKEMKTPDYLVEALGDSLTPEALPGLSFIICALCSFFIGTSWGTMSIMFPLITPLAYEVSDGDKDVVIHAMGTILAGAVFGDHCSPISDTTVLSSIACGCDHKDHVYTQLVYALTVGMISVIFGDFVGRAMGDDLIIISYIIGLILLLGVVLVFGTPIPVYTPPNKEEGEKDGKLDETPLDAVSLFESIIGVTLYSHPYEDPIVEKDEEENMDDGYLKSDDDDDNQEVGGDASPNNTEPFQGTEMTDKRVPSTGTE